jgi:hypothetical protein
MQPWAQDTERRETKLKQCLFLIRHIVKSGKNFVGDKGNKGNKGNKEIYVKRKRSIVI